MSGRVELVHQKQAPESKRTGVAHVVASDAPMALEHAGQTAWEQAAVGTLCAVGGGLLAYWSLQGIIGLAVIALCVTFSTLVTSALGQYYDHTVARQDAPPPRPQHALTDGR